MNKLRRCLGTASVVALALAASGSAVAASKADGPGAAGQAQAGAGVQGQGLRARLRAGGQGQSVGQAQGVGQGQAGRRVAQQRHAFGGTVSAVDSGSLSLSVAKAGPRDRQLVGTSVTLSVGPSTTVSGKGISQLADVKAGDRVAVVATGDATQGLTAVQIRVARAQTAQRVGLSGSVAAVGASSLTIDVKRADKRNANLVGTSVTVNVDSSTKVTGKGVAQLADVKAGDTVAVIASGDPTQGLTASQIRDNRPLADRRHFLGGTVAAVGPTSVSIAVKKAGKADQSLVGQTVTVAVSGTTQFTGKGAKQLSDVQTNDTVGVSATGDATQGFAAVQLRDVTGMHLHWIAGTVTAASSSSLTVSVERTGPYDAPLADQTATFAVDSSTVVIRNHEGSHASIGDVQTGMTVGVLFTARGRNFTSGLAATRIHIWEKTAVSQIQSDQPAPQPVPAAPAG